MPRAADGFCAARSLTPDVGGRERPDASAEASALPLL